jgi:hypothetical protein
VYYSRAEGPFASAAAAGIVFAWNQTRARKPARSVLYHHLRRRQDRDPGDKNIGVPLRFQHVHFNIEPKLVDQVFDVAPRMAPNGTTKVAFLYDPWGTYIELTQGLAPAKLTPGRAFREKTPRRVYRW